ncbi:hypothetical protein ACFPM7_19095 [Actinokineospora guangxiensis]|uniref:Uncharacterized protein n=1 Tax=Actinokineospora guangxiensis TaxID=1490288 RepID=A0ABW0EQN9_9PSEU
MNGYLAASESVLWPLALALLWVGLAAGLLSVEAPKSAEPRRAVRRAPARAHAEV